MKITCVNGHDTSEVGRDSKSTCKACKYEKTVGRNKEIIRLAKDRPCADCGGRFPVAAMDFDHVRGVKLYNVGMMLTRSVVALLDEIAKCEIVCANCHRIRTFSR
jgi:hypothetical protein